MSGWSFRRCYSWRRCSRYCISSFRRAAKAFTCTRSKIVQRETLNKLAVEIGLDKLIKSSTRTSSHNSYMYGNAFEAFVGAIYIDQGMISARCFWKRKSSNGTSTSINCRARRLTSSQNWLNGAKRARWKYRLSLLNSSSTKTPIRYFKRKSWLKDYLPAPAPAIQERVATECRSNGFEEDKDQSGVYQFHRKHKDGPHHSYRYSRSKRSRQHPCSAYRVGYEKWTGAIIWSRHPFFVPERLKSCSSVTSFSLPATLLKV